MKKGKAQQQVYVKTNDIPEGMYIVNIKGKKGQTSQKIMRKP